MSGKRDALIIATYEYADKDLSRLLAPYEDARDLGRVLADPKIGDYNVKVVLNRPTQEVNEEIESFFGDRSRDDRLLLYFSCHGVKDVSGRLYFATTSTKMKLLGSTAVSSYFVNDVMSNSRARLKILLLDCCYAGAFARGLSAKADRSVGTLERFDEGLIVMAASDEMQYAFEGDDLKGTGTRSVFTRNLVRGLATGEADTDNDGHISLGELYNYTYDHVVAETPGQRPRISSLGMQGKIIVAKNPSPVEVRDFGESDETDRRAALRRLELGLRSSAPALDEGEWHILLRAARRGKVVPVVGPGARPDAVPADHEVAQRWARQHSYDGERPWELPKVAQFLAAERGPLYPHRLLEEESGQVHAPDFDDPENLYGALAALPIPVYVTTNYDDLLSEALNARGKSPVSEFCRWNNVPSTVDELDPTAASPLVFNLFGYYKVPESLVLTAEDHTNFIWNVSRDPWKLPPRVREALVGSLLLFVGYPPDDVNFQTLTQAVGGFVRRNYQHKLKGSGNTGVGEFAEELRGRWRAFEGD
ncbi:MAG TPA: SIR2 family protein [Pyrinomonadaceae bacterium]|nr:SIR2 family protein [Pyrinomonadaceae bacterium]